MSDATLPVEAAVSTGAAQPSRIARLAPLLLLPAMLVGYSIFNGLTVAKSFAEQQAVDLMGRLNWVDGSGPRAIDAMFATASAHSELTHDFAILKRLAGVTDAGEGARVGKDGWLFFGDNFNVPEDVRPAVDAAVDRMVETVRLLEQHGSEVTIVVLPSKAEVEVEHHDWPVFAERAGAARRLLNAELVAKGVNAVDPFEAIGPAKKRAPVSWANDMHWTVHGSRTIAHEVGKAIVRGGDLGNDVTLIEGPEETFLGDLAQALGAAPYLESPYLALEKVRPFVAVHSDGVDLAPSFEQAEAVLVGGSGSQIERWSFADFLRYELQEPIANMSVWGKGAVYPMDMAIEEFERTGHFPEKVIWEFSLVSIFDPIHMAGARSQVR